MTGIGPGPGNDSNDSDQPLLPVLEQRTVKLRITLSKAQKHLDHPRAKATVESCDQGGTFTTQKGSIDRMLRGASLGPISHLQKTQDDLIHYTNQFQTQQCTLSLMSDSSSCLGTSSMSCTSSLIMAWCK